MKDMRTTIFGWRGVSFELPREWELVREVVEKKHGYFDMEDELMLRLRVYWERIPFEKSPELIDQLNKIIKQLKKKSKELKTVGRLRMKVHGHDAILTRVKLSPPLEMLLLVWYCEDRERSYVIHLYYKTKEYEYIEDVFRKIVSSLRCHGKEYLWSFQGISIRLPSEYEAVAYRVTSGLSWLRLYNSKTRDYIFILYNTMGSELLRDYYRSVHEWYLDLVKKEVSKIIGKRVERGRENTKIAYHSGIKIREGTMALLRKKVNTISYIWYCDKTNRLISVVIAPSKAKDLEKLQRVMDTIRCH
ncbi:MAG: hypothetical protein DRJ49_00350 [Thermoprotei archaeon]|nr:MAG: hypothetical protein DRN53_01525 [Thermoprotei archaeon]RLE90262.1 MAG: hypothetical protein DRJ49_00350 [Thermoprotei archaeon]